MWWDGGWGAGGWVLTSLLMLVFWALVVAGVVALVRSRDRGRQAPDEDSARRILDERFARGELTEEEYTRRRDLLTSR